jgi:hypothetical protein
MLVKLAVSCNPYFVVRFRKESMLRILTKDVAMAKALMQLSGCLATE